MGPARVRGSLPVLGFAAASGTGKTTLLSKLIPLLRAHGLRVGVIKHTHHDFEIDQPGKDSYVLRQAGAAQTLLASGQRLALIVETPEQRGDPALAALLERLDLGSLDIVLVEGFRHERIPKIELHRAAAGRPLLFPEDDSVIAVATDVPLPTSTDLPVLDLNDPGQIAAFIIRRLSE